MAWYAGRHLGLKLLSIAVAAALWLAISGQQIVERALRIPLEYTNLPLNLEMTGDAPMVVDVRVRGSSAALSRIAPGELVAVLDLRSARPGHRLFHLTGVDVRRPFGLDVVQATPSNIAISFEQSDSKVVPVAPAIEGSPALGFEVRKTSAKPPTVEVVGPSSALKNLTEAITEPVSIEGASRPVRETVNVGVPDQAVRLRTPQSSVIVVDIGPRAVDRSMPDVAVTAHGARSAASVLKPARVSVEVRGMQDAIAGLASAQLDAFVDVDGLSPGRYHLPVKVVAPAQVTVIRVAPAQVQVNLR